MSQVISRDSGEFSNYSLGKKKRDFRAIHLGLRIIMYSTGTRLFGKVLWNNLVLWIMKNRVSKISKDGSP